MVSNLWIILTAVFTISWMLIGIFSESRQSIQYRSIRVATAILAMVFFGLALGNSLLRAIVFALIVGGANLALDRYVSQRRLSRRQNGIS